MSFLQSITLTIDSLPKIRIAINSSLTFFSWSMCLDSTVRSAADEQGHGCPPWGSWIYAWNAVSVLIHGYHLINLSWFKVSQRLDSEFISSNSKYTEGASVNCKRFCVTLKVFFFFPFSIGFSLQLHHFLGFSCRWRN